MSILSANLGKNVGHKAPGRRSAREWALQLMFSIDANPPPSEDLCETIADFWEQQILISSDKGEISSENLNAIAPKSLRTFTEALVKGAWENRDAIDAKITSYLANWSIPRMGAVDRNVLRLAFYEMFWRDETPPVVIINEAVDIAKFFSTRDSGKFVNGILDKASKDCNRPIRGKQSTGPQEK